MRRNGLEKKAYFKKNPFSLLRSPVNAVQLHSGFCFSIHFPIYLFKKRIGEAGKQGFISLEVTLIVVRYRNFLWISCVNIIFNWQFLGALKV